MQAPLAGPRSHLTEQVVADALSLGHSPQIRWGVDVLGVDDQLVPGESVPVTEGSVSWRYRPPDLLDVDAGAAAEVRRSATLVLVGDVGVDVLARRFRVWAGLRASSGEWVRWDQGVFISTVPRTNDDGVLIRRELNLADKTWLLAQRKLTDPLVWPAGANVVTWVTDRLNSLLGETSFEIPATSVTFGAGRVVDAGVSELAALNAALEVAAFDALTASESGRFRSVPMEQLAGKGPERTYGPGQGKVVVAGTVDSLVPSLPNVVRFVARQAPSLAEEGNGIRTKTNQSTGPASIDQRGVEIHETVEVEAEDQAELDAIADAEAQRWFAGGGQRAELQVGWCPAHSDRDVVSLDKPRLGLSGDWLVTGWTLPLRPVDSEQAVLMPLTCEQRVDVSGGV